MITIEQVNAMQADAEFDGKMRTTLQSILSTLTTEERVDLLKLNPLRSWWAIGVNWGLIFASMALVAWAWPNPWLTVPAVILALFVIGCRQLGMAVIMHDAGHRAMFRNPKLNDWVGNWMGAYPIWLSMGPYARQHRTHHIYTWTEKDPDIGLVLPFPVSRASLRRKLWRDISGQTGVKFMKLRLQRTFSGREATFTGKPKDDEIRRGFRGMLIMNGVLLGMLFLAGYPALYLLWFGAYMTTNNLVTRIRSIAEHSMVEDIADPLQNTRTTLASWWERLFLAPIRVNYHLEHHLMMTAPHYNLPKMHRLLKDRGAIKDALVTQGYASVLRRAVSDEPEPAPAPA